MRKRRTGLRATLFEKKRQANVIYKALGFNADDEGHLNGYSPQDYNHKAMQVT